MEKYNKNNNNNDEERKRDNNNLLISNNNSEEEEKEINEYKEEEDYLEEEDYFYGNDYIQNLNNILNNEKKEKNKGEKIKGSEIFDLKRILNSICKINPKTIIYLFDYDNQKNEFKTLLMNDKIGQIDFDSVIIREYLPYLNENKEFYIKFFQIITKVVYPSIQIFYGLLNKESQINKNIEIVLEYISSSLEEVQIFIKKCLIGNNMNYLIIYKISEVLSYIYECGYPYLMLYPSNIRFNNKLFKQYFQVDEDSSYLYTINKNYFSDPSKIFNNNFMKITNIGNYLKYKYLNRNSKYYSLKDELLRDICYFSPELIKFVLDDNIKDFLDNINILEKWDVYSFGCLLFYIFYKQNPYYYIINDININEEDKYELLIKTIKSENNFLKKQIEHLENSEKEINIPPEIIKLINNCTSYNIELRPTFNNIFDELSNQIKDLIKNNSNKNNKNSSKDIFHDYSFYQLSKYNNDLIIAKEIIKNNKLKEELTDINSEYNNSKKIYINYYKDN